MLSFNHEKDNPDFNVLEFDYFKKHSGENSFVLWCKDCHKARD